MTAQAILFARESRPIEPLIVQSVENTTEFRIGRRDLQYRRTRDERNINVVVEKDRTRIIRRDETPLKGSLGEDERLR